MRCSARVRVHLCEDGRTCTRAQVLLDDELTTTLYAVGPGGSSEQIELEMCMTATRA